MSNEEWFDNFANNTVLHLSKVTFDHKPVLVHYFISIGRRGISKVRGPFVFLQRGLPTIGSLISLLIHGTLVLSIIKGLAISLVRSQSRIRTILETSLEESARFWLVMGVI